MRREDLEFLFLEQVMIAVIKDHLVRESIWEITKTPGVAQWEAQPFNEETQEAFLLCINEICVDFELVRDDHPETVAYCYVEVYAFGVLRDFFIEYGVRPRFKISVFNELGSDSICLTDPDEVEEAVGLLEVWIEDDDKIPGLMENLEISWLADMI